MKKLINIIEECSPSLVPYNKSDKKNKMIASQKMLKYIMPKKARQITKKARKVLKTKV